MSRIFSWFQKKNNAPLLPAVRKKIIDNLIIEKQIKELTLCLQNKEDRTHCIDEFFHLLSTIFDEPYMASIFELIIKKSRLSSAQVSTIIVSKLSRAIANKEFDLCEKILRLPYSATSLSLSTYDLSQLISSCPDPEQIIRCLSVLMSKNLPFDAEYISWILIILVEHFKPGNEIIIEHILNKQNAERFLYAPYGEYRVTPFMIFFHSYSNPKCQAIIDRQLSNMQDPSVLLQCDRWNRSYLMNLLCGECQHGTETDSTKILATDLTEINDELMKKCPHALDILVQFSFLHKLGNKCETPMKTIFSSRLCFPLRVRLFNYLWENDGLTEYKLEDFFTNFPSDCISTYHNYVKRLVQNQNLDQSLFNVINNRTNSGHGNEKTINFLLQEGARIRDMRLLSPSINILLNERQSLIPFMLLDYSMSLQITSDILLQAGSNNNKNLYICRAIHCGYSSVSHESFKTYKSTLLSESLVSSVDKLIDLKNPTSLSNLCRQKLRNSLKNLGDDTTNKLKENLPTRLVQSIKLYEYREWLQCYRTVMRGS